RAPLGRSPEAAQTGCEDHFRFGPKICPGIPREALEDGCGRLRFIVERGAGDCKGSDGATCGPGETGYSCAVCLFGRRREHVTRGWRFGVKGRAFSRAQRTAASFSAASVRHAPGY